MDAWCDPFFRRNRRCFLFTRCVPMCLLTINDRTQNTTIANKKKKVKRRLPADLTFGYTILEINARDPTKIGALKFVKCE